MFTFGSLLGSVRFRHGLILFVLLAGCSPASPEQSLVFETGDEFGVEVVLGDRSLLPSCSGEGFCSNAVAFTGALDEAGQEIAGVLLSPCGDRVFDLDAALTSRVSPSGNWLLAKESDGFARLGADGSRVELSRSFSTFEWIAGDLLLAQIDSEVHILDADGALIEAIVDAPSDVRFRDISQDGDLLLFLAFEVQPDSDPNTSFWIYERSTSSWSQLDHGAGYTNHLSHSGFGPGDTSVIVQLEGLRMESGADVAFDYRIEAIDIASGDVAVLEESTGAGLQFSSVAPDGRTVAIRGSNMLRVVDIASGRSSPFVLVGGHTRSGAPTWSWDSQLIDAGPDTVAVVTAGREPQLSLPIDVTPAEFQYGNGALFGAR